MLRLRASIAAAILVATAPPLAGQICRGTAPFAYGPVRLGVFGQVAENLNSIEAQAAAGARTAGVFGGFGITRESYVGAVSRILGGHVGYSIPLAWSGRIEVCPIASREVESGPTFEIAVGMPDESMASRANGLGLGIGAKLISLATFEFIPFVSATSYWNVQDITFQGSTSTTRERTYTLVGGAAFVLDKGVTLRPSVAFPFRNNATAPNYGFAMAVTLPGGKTK